MQCAAALPGAARARMMRQQVAKAPAGIAGSRLLWAGPRIVAPRTVTARAEGKDELAKGEDQDVQRTAGCAVYVSKAVDLCVHGTADLLHCRKPP